MLAATHLVSGAALGRVVRHPVGGLAAAVALHAVLDGVGHEDSLYLPAQSLLSAGALALVAWRFGPLSHEVRTALASAAPDAEIAVILLTGREATARPWFVSHRRSDGHLAHPYRFGPWTLPLAAEVAITSAVLAALCLPRRRG